MQRPQATVRLDLVMACRRQSQGYGFGGVRVKATHGKTLVCSADGLRSVNCECSKERALFVAIK